MSRLLGFLKLVVGLTLLMFAAWWLSVRVLPQGILRPYLSRLFAERVGELTFGKVLLANLVPFFGIQFMNLFRTGRHSGGLYVLPVLWTFYGVLLGTNSFVFAGRPIPFSIAVLWSRTGFTELLAYTASYEATKGWTLWEQQGLWKVRPLPGTRWRPEAADWAYWAAPAFLLAAAVAREVSLPAAGPGAVPAAG